MRKETDPDLIAYKQMIGSEEYNRLYHLLYTESKRRLRDGHRFSGENDKKVDLESIKEKYRHGVTPEILHEMYMKLGGEK